MKQVNVSTDIDQKIVQEIIAQQYNYSQHIAGILCSNRIVAPISIHQLISMPTSTELKRIGEERIAREKRIDEERLGTIANHLLAEINDQVIQFQVLSIDEASRRALAISKDCIKIGSYHNSGCDITWETCTLRKWLNTEFYDSLSVPIKQRIIESELSYPDRGYVENSATTKDKIFLLSVNEVVRYFPDYKSRIANNNGNPTWWWLRSPGNNSNIAAIVDGNGSVLVNGNYVNRDRGGVRPAFWLDLGP